MSDVLQIRGKCEPMEGSDDKMPQKIQSSQWFSRLWPEYRIYLLHWHFLAQQSKE